MAALGRPGYITLGHADDLKKDYSEAAMENHAHDVMDAAWNGGVRYFDTARSYGLAEKFLTSWLSKRKMSRDAVTIASKWGYTYTADWKVHAAMHEIKDHSLPVLQRQWRESKELLGEYLRVYQIHSTTLETGALENAGVLNELAGLRNEGICIGLTVTGPEQATTLLRAMTVKIDGIPLFGIVQATWNLLEQSVGSALAEAHAAGMGVVIKESLANGRLTERNQNPTFASKLALLKTEASRLNCSIDALPLASVLAQPFVDVVLSGATTSTQLHSNLQAEKLSLDADTLSRLNKICEPATEYWAMRKSMPWN
ncbi:MAG: pld [Verrucomicrobiales bacterium]|nr:pld [Verrucomicrobiales bacterium]